MFFTPAARRAPMARLRQAANARGALPIRNWEAWAKRCRGRGAGLRSSAVSAYGLPSGHGRCPLCGPDAGCPSREGTPVAGVAQPRLAAARCDEQAAEMTASPRTSSIPMSRGRTSPGSPSDPAARPTRTTSVSRRSEARQCGPTRRVHRAWVPNPLRTEMFSARCDARNVTNANAASTACRRKTGYAKGTGAPGNRQ